MNTSQRYTRVHLCQYHHTPRAPTPLLSAVALPAPHLLLRLNFVHLAFLIHITQSPRATPATHAWPAPA